MKNVFLYDFIPELEHYRLWEAKQRFVDHQIVYEQWVVFAKRDNRINSNRFVGVSFKRL